MSFLIDTGLQSLVRPFLYKELANSAPPEKARSEARSVIESNLSSFQDGARPLSNLLIYDDDVITEESIVQELLPRKHTHVPQPTTPKPCGLVQTEAKRSE
jgi:hypothetical protein